MDEKKKQTIEEMELVMQNACGCRYFSTKDMILNNDRFFNREATALYNAGYRKGSDTAREILTELKNTRFHKGTLTYDFEVAVNRLAEKFGVDLGE